jgi:hypothetical protein
VPTLLVAAALLVVGGVAAGVVASRHSALSPPDHPVAVARAIGLQQHDLGASFRRVGTGSVVTDQKPRRGCRLSRHKPWASVESPLYAGNSTNAESDVALLASDADAQTVMRSLPDASYGDRCVKPNQAKAVATVVSSANRAAASCPLTIGDSTFEPVTVATSQQTAAGFRYVATISSPCPGQQHQLILDTVYTSVGNVVLGGTFLTIDSPNSALEQRAMNAMSTRAHQYVSST